MASWNNYEEFARGKIEVAVGLIMELTGLGESRATANLFCTAITENLPVVTVAEAVLLLCAEHRQIPPTADEAIVEGGTQTRKLALRLVEPPRP
jgi:hypothetical protein